MSVFNRQVYMCRILNPRSLFLLLIMNLFFVFFGGGGGGGVNIYPMLFTWCLFSGAKLALLFDWSTKSQR